MRRCSRGRGCIGSPARLVDRRLWHKCCFVLCLRYAINVGPKEPENDTARDGSSFRGAGGHAICARIFGVPSFGKENSGRAGTRDQLLPAVLGAIGVAELQDDLRVLRLLYVLLGLLLTRTWQLPGAAESINKHMHDSSFSRRFQRGTANDGTGCERRKRARH